MLSRSSVTRREWTERPWVGYALSIALVTLATLLRMSLDPILGDYAPLTVYNVAVMFAAWYGGWRPALLAMVSGCLLADYLFIAPRGSILIHDLEHQVGIVLYCVVGLVVIVFTESLQRSRRRAEAARAELAVAVDALAKQIGERERAEQETARLASFPMRNPEPVVEAGMDGRVCFVNPAAQRLFPDLQQLGPDHPWLSNWDSLANACREPSASLVARDVAVGERHYHQVMHYVPEVQRVRIYGEDITERKRVEEALQQTAEALERSNKDLEQFASVASHDLQEPLRTVSGFVQLLQKKYANQLDTEADTFIEYAVDGTRRMETLIKNLLAYSRVTTRGTELVPTDAGAALRQALDNLHATIQDAGAEITYGELPTVRADGTQLAQLFQNLIGNALKFHGGAPPKIHVDASRQGDHWLFSVRDNGIGIAPEFQDRIFLIFERLHSRQKYPGTGVGLAICKRIVDRHGGRIWVESKPGQGATFSFTLPT